LIWEAEMLLSNSRDMAAFRVFTAIIFECSSKAETTGLCLWLSMHHVGVSDYLAEYDLLITIRAYRRGLHQTIVAAD
jgi:hypothetical protein